MSPLDRKLLRDLWRMKTQAMAIALVLAVGVMLLVMMNGMYNSILQTRGAYYDQYRLADIFAPVKRAPTGVLERIAEIPGVSAVQGRVVGGALIDLEGRSTPIRAQTVSLPAFNDPRLNDFYLADGRKLDSRRHDEILLLQGFANAHGLSPGDELSATMNGARRTFKIVGLAEAPEFLYTTAPGEIFPDDSRFAVIWMNQDALEAAFDLDGAFNEALVSLDRSASSRAVLDEIDRILTPYGGTGAYHLDDHFSNIFISEEIDQLAITSKTVPPVFMAVAAFLLYIVISRMVQAERMQIGLLKAFGYTSIEVSLHYLKLVLVIAVCGAVVGCALGIWTGQLMAEYFQVYYKFPFLLFRVDPGAFLIAVLVSVITASAGSLAALFQVFRLTPAVAMRPPAPTDYSASANIIATLRDILDQPTRMVLRRLLRHPMRAGAAILGISAGMGLTVAQMGVMDGFTRTIDLSFSIVDRSDATVSFIEPMGDQALFALGNVGGVMRVEPFRSTPAILRNGNRTHRGAIDGRVPDPELNRAMSADMSAIHIRSDGVTLSRQLATKLAIEPGDRLTLEIREGRRPVLDIPVVAITEALMGSPAYMELDALNRALGEGYRVSGAYVSIDSDQSQYIYERLKDMPIVAGVSLQDEARAAIEKLMNEGAGSARYIMALVAGVIAFGIVYNSARIAFAERSHDLASLRVLGFTKNETAFVLLGELGVMTLLAIPIGVGIGMGLADAIAAGFSNDLYTIPSDIGPSSIGIASLTVALSAIFSGWLVKRDIDRLDMVSALKSRE